MISLDSLFQVAKLTKQSIVEQQVVDDISKSIEEAITNLDGTTKPFEEIKDLDFREITGLRSPTPDEMDEHIQNYEKYVKRTSRFTQENIK